MWEMLKDSPLQVYKETEKDYNTTHQLKKQARTKNLAFFVYDLDENAIYYQTTTGTIHK